MLIKKHRKRMLRQSSSELAQRSLIAYSWLRLGSIIIITRTKRLRDGLSGQCPRTAECVISSSLEFCR